MRALCLAFVLIALAVGCQTGSSSMSLKVGDCFNYSEGVDANGDTVQQIDTVDCSQPHSDEVFSVFVYPNASGFPGYEAIGTVQQSQCEADFAAYVGTTWDKSSYTINYEAPDEQTWNGGDHTIRCLIEDGSGAQTTGSAHGTAK